MEIRKTIDCSTHGKKSLGLTLVKDESQILVCQKCFAEKSEAAMLEARSKTKGVIIENVEVAVIRRSCKRGSPFVREAQLL